MASDRAGSVVALDKQEEAVECARKNVALNHLETKVQVRHGDLFSALEVNERFHVILFNIPFPPWKPKTPCQEANFDEGHQLLTRFIKEAKSYLHPVGRIGMTWSDIGDTDRFHQLLATKNYSYRVLVERKIGEVGQHVYELTPHATG